MPEKSGAPSVPFLDLARIHRPLTGRILKSLASLIDDSQFIDGPAVTHFERAFAEYCGVGACAGVGSGLDALRLALLAAGIESGDEVAVPANTFIATFEAIRQAGGVPVPVDVSERDYNIDVDALAAAFGPRTAFVLPVHLYGQMADMRRVSEVAAAAGVRVLEDACQAHGATRDGVRAGAAGLAGAFSFYPAKNLGAMGDGGALVTDDDALAETVRALRQHGQRQKYSHEREGYTSRLDAVQAVVLAEKLPLLDSWNAQRARLAAAYAELLDGVGDLVLPPIAEGSEPVWHLYVVRTASPGDLAARLARRRIATGRHYPQPPHLSQAYACLGYRRGTFPITELLADELLSLPLFPGMTYEQVEAVAEALRGVFASR